MTYTLSASSLKLMKDCPVCFWWQVKKGIRRPTGPMSQLPNRVEEQIIARFDIYRENGNLPPELSELSGMTLFKDKKKLKQWKNKGLIFVCNDEFCVTAKPDDLLEHNGKLVILDYKTAGKRGNCCTQELLTKDVEEYDYQLQLDLYNYVFRNSGMDTGDWGYLLFLFVNGMDNDGKIILGSKVIKRKINIENAENNLKKAFEMLRKENPPEGGCPFCLSVRERHQQGLEQEENREAHKGSISR